MNLVSLFLLSLQEYLSIMVLRYYGIMVLWYANTWIKSNCFCNLKNKELSLLKQLFITVCFIAVYLRCLKLHEKASPSPDRSAAGPSSQSASQAETAARRTPAAVQCYTLSVILIISDITNK